ncbi:MAG: T9SS type A sorting domain-containing protein [Bacteroidetes bacterium]|nr:T9SS type A sorting domain-containing protein [Bacteroidota bacterium]
MKTSFLFFSLFLLSMGARAQTCTPEVFIRPVDSTFLSIYCNPARLVYLYVDSTVHSGSSPQYNWYFNDSLIASSTDYVNFTGEIDESDTIYVEMTSNDPCANAATVRSNLLILHTDASTPFVLSGGTSMQAGCQGAQVMYYFTTVDVDSVMIVSNHYYMKRLSPPGTWAAPRTDTVVGPAMPGERLDPYVRAYNLVSIGYCSTGFAFDTGLYAIGDTIPTQNLCMVSIDSTTQMPHVIWEKADKAATDSFYIYRTSSPDSAYSQVAVLSRDSLSEWADQTASADSFSYRYMIALMDTCCNLSPQSPYIQTLYLSATGNGGFTWVPYAVEGDTSSLTYALYRDSAGLGDWQLIQTAARGQTSLTDPQYSLYPGANYRLVVVLPYTCVPSRNTSTILSNTLQRPYLISGLDLVGQELSISVSPNPVADKLSISCAASMSNPIRLEVSDAMGQIVLATTTQKEQLVISTAPFPPGVYHLKAYTNNEMKLIRIVKQ